MNVLFTSVGRRYYLLDYFRKNINKKIKIISSNSSNYTSAKNHSAGFDMMEYLINQLLSI